MPDFPLDLPCGTPRLRVVTSWGQEQAATTEWVTPRNRIVRTAFKGLIEYARAIGFEAVLAVHCHPDAIARQAVLLGEAIDQRPPGEARDWTDPALEFFDLISEEPVDWMLHEAPIDLRTHSSYQRLGWRLARLGIEDSFWVSAHDQHGQSLGGAAFLAKKSIMMIENDRRALRFMARLVLAGASGMLPRPPSMPSPLTGRELSILVLISAGFTAEEIADQEGLSFNTVNAYIRKICGKLGAKNRLHAVTIAIRAGLLQEANA